MFIIEVGQRGSKLPPYAYAIAVAGDVPRIVASLKAADTHGLFSIAAFPADSVADLLAHIREGQPLTPSAALDGMDALEAAEKLGRAIADAILADARRR